MFLVQFFKASLLKKNFTDNFNSFGAREDWKKINIFFFKGFINMRLILDVFLHFLPPCTLPYAQKLKKFTKKIF